MRLKLIDADWLLYDALAAVGDACRALVPRSLWPTLVLRDRRRGRSSRARTGRSHAIWFVAACAQTSSLDHRSPNAGNFVLSRGAADLIVDPSPYGSLSTLTGNAPTVVSKHLPPNYIPSQGAWGEDVAWRWVTKDPERRRRGALRLQPTAYRFQDTKTDVPEALRDFVLLLQPRRPRRVAGRARSRDHRRGRSQDVPAVPRAGRARDRPGRHRHGDDQERAPHDQRRTGAHRGRPDPAQGLHFKAGTTRGNCDAARFPVTDYRVELAGPRPHAVHVIEATGAQSDQSAKGAATSTAISGDGWTGVRIQGTRDAVVVWPNQPNGGLVTYRAPRAAAVTHVVQVDAPAIAGKATITAKPDGDACVVTVVAGGAALSATPVLVTLDDGCAIAADSEEPQRRLGGAQAGRADAQPVRPSGAAAAAARRARLARRSRWAPWCWGCCGGAGERPARRSLMTLVRDARIAPPTP